MEPKVFVSRLIPENGLALIRQHCETIVWEEPLPPPREVILEVLPQMDGLLCLLTDKIDATIMDAAPHLKVISNYAVGFDNIDIAAATAHKIPVGNTPGVLTDSTADLAFALLMAAARRLIEGAAYVQAGQWQTWEPQSLLGHDIHNATLGILGFGRIGQAVARRAQGFGMRVLYHNRTPNNEAAKTLGAEYCSFETLLAEADFVSIHVPLNAETHHLIDDRALQLMKPNAILVNTARGPIIDPKALYRTLKDKKIAFAALDVTDPEPILFDDPLLSLENCLVVPHIGSATLKTRGKMAAMAAENLVAGVLGKRLPHCVNPIVYDR